MKNKPDDTNCPYNLSKDYAKALDLLTQKKDLICYVNYEFSDNKVSRDVCRVRRFSDFHIQIGVRGMEYGGVYRFNKEDGTELELFQKECHRMNASFILPNN